MVVMMVPIAETTEPWWPDIYKLSSRDSKDSPWWMRLGREGGGCKGSKNPPVAKVRPLLLYVSPKWAPPLGWGTISDVKRFDQTTFSRMLRRFFPDTKVCDATWSSSREPAISHQLPLRPPPCYCHSDPSVVLPPLLCVADHHS